MPIRVYYDEPESTAGWCTIRPTPFISISTSILKTGGSEEIGVTYQITLTGTLLAHAGSPYASYYAGNSQFDIAPSAIAPPVYPPTPEYIGPYGAFDSSTSHFLGSEPADRPPPQTVTAAQRLGAILFKQKAIRELFSKDFRQIEITDWDDDSNSAIYCYPRVVSIDFQEGQYVETCSYTITLEADSLLDSSSFVDKETTLIATEPAKKGKTWKEVLEADLVDPEGEYKGAFIQSYSEDWSIEVEDSYGETVQGDLNIYLPKAYRVSRNLNCTGKNHFVPNDREYAAWEMAQLFVTNKLKRETANGGQLDQYYPNNGLDNLLSPVRKLASGTMSLLSTYRGCNHVITEQVNTTDGSFSVSESWLLATGTAFENYTMNITEGIDSPFLEVSINGTIQGLTNKDHKDFDGVSHQLTGATPADSSSDASGAYRSAINKFYEISNNGSYGISSDIYKRANNATSVELNSQPNSVTIGTNYFTGEITYALSFDNRPLNIISGVLSEDISVNDTYPGDVIAVIPVLGRQTGPVLQYLGGRTEYSRDVQINLLMDYTKIPYGKERDPLILKKPSVVQPQATQIQQLLLQVSPANEPGVRKYFLSGPPSESWNPKTGQYNLSLSWVYELDK